MLLILVALAGLVLTLLRRPALASTPAKDYDTPAPAAGASVTQVPPAPREPMARPAQAPADPNIDIYKVIQQQPQAPAPPSGGDAKPEA